MNRHIALIAPVRFTVSLLLLCLQLAALLLLGTALFAYSWTMLFPLLIVGALTVLFGMMVFTFAGEGIDIKDGYVLLQDINGNRIRFHQHELVKITLETECRQELEPRQFPLHSVNIVFLLKSGRRKRYLAARVSQRQWERVRRTFQADMDRQKGPQ